jgi:hypothetical protein
MISQPSHPPYKWEEPRGCDTDNIPISSEDFRYLKPINDRLLADLGWDYATAKHHLIERFGVVSRKELTYGQFWRWTLFCEDCLGG